MYLVAMYLYLVVPCLNLVQSSHLYRLHHFGYIACSSAQFACLACAWLQGTWFDFTCTCICTACTSLVVVTLLARLPGLLVALHAGIVPGDTEQDTGEAEWGNCHFHMSR